VHVGETSDLAEAHQPYPDQGSPPQYATAAGGAPASTGTPGPENVGHAVRGVLDSAEPPYLPEDAIDVVVLPHPPGPGPAEPVVPPPGMVPDASRARWALMARLD
jgi:hypothetical protein